jgi:hypothetical protein
MDRSTQLVFVLAIACLSCRAAAQTAEGPWFLQTDLQALAIGYDGATERDYLRTAGLFLKADYYERGGFTLGYNGSTLTAIDGSPDTEQDALFLSGRYSLTPDALNGRLTLRLDSHSISLSDASGQRDDVQVLAPQVSYLNWARTFYADIGWARSNHDDPQSTDFEVEQLTPTLGFGFNEQRDWIQLRGYLTRVAARQLQGRERNSALELKWTHWLAESAFLGLDNVRWSVLGGERLFPVDPDAGAVYNLAELQTGAWTLGGEWTLGARNRVLLLFGGERYRTESGGDDYDSAVFYLNFSRQWR